MEHTIITVITLMIGMIGISLANWGLLRSFRTDSKNDFDKWDARNKLETNKWDARNREDWKMCHEMIQSIQTEMKDFHNRLCQIEAQRK